MKNTIINAHNFNRLSEIMDYLPHGVLNKVKTDTGGTFLAANCPENYIIVCPLCGLVDSIAADKNNKYEIFVCKGGVTEYDWKRYAKRNTIHKIAVTWDSFHKLLTWLPDFNYKVVADEAHLILQNMDFREDAINQFMSDIKKFDHYTFMTATPIDNEFEPDFMKELPHYKVDWGELTKIMPIRFKTTSILKALTRMISIFLDEGIGVPNIYGELTKVEELHIFINSVTSIKQVLDTLKYNGDVKIVCADRIRNSKLLGKYEINKVTDPNCKINFYTSTAFQGCNMFTNNGLIIVVSDAYKTKDMIDITSDLEQIVGRFRLNDEFQNCFRNTLVHLYTTNHNIPTKEEFEAQLNTKIEEGKELIKLADKATITQLNILEDRLNLENDVVSIVNNKMSINDLKINMFKFKYSLRAAYRNGFTIKDAYCKSEKFVEVKQQNWTDLNVKMTKATIFSYKDLYLDYLATKDASYDKEFPEFKGYYTYLKDTEMNSLKYNKEKMMRLVKDKQKFIYEVIPAISKKFGRDFASSKDLKDFMKIKFEELGIIQLKPKASLLEDFGAIKTSKRLEKKTQGYILNDLTTITFKF